MTFQNYLFLEKYCILFLWHVFRVFEAQIVNQSDRFKISKEQPTRNIECQMCKLMTICLHDWSPSAANKKKIQTADLR